MIDNATNGGLFSTCTVYIIAVATTKESLQRVGLTAPMLVITGYSRTLCTLKECISGGGRRGDFLGW